MSYDKHVWLRKELISAAKLNNIENGIAAATNALELLKLQVNAAHQLNAHVYGIKFDKTTHTCTRLFDAANITTDTTNFCHKGTINPNYDNPFDNIYPWSEFKLCNVDLDKFKTLTADDDIRDCVTAWYGEPTFTFDDPEVFVGRYRPPFAYYAYADNDYQIFVISDFAVDGWGWSPATIDSYGLLTYQNLANTLADTKLGCYHGLPACGQEISLNTIHAKAKAQGFTLQNIYSVSAITTAYLVEYTDTNGQLALSDGCSSVYYVQATTAHPFVDDTNTNRIVVPIAAKQQAVIGAQIDLVAVSDRSYVWNTDQGYRRICIGIEDYTPDPTNYFYLIVNEAIPTISTEWFINIHGTVNGLPHGNESGYIGVATKTDTFYRGAAMWGNRWRYILGAYREKDTDHIWIAKNIYDCDNYDALNTEQHIDTGVVIGRTNDGTIASTGYIKTLVTGGEINQPLGFVPFCTELGGNSTNPWGDYSYVPAITTGNTVCFLGGSALNGAGGGPGYAYWYYGSGFAHWSSGASGQLILPQKNSA